MNTCVILLTLWWTNQPIAVNIGHVLYANPGQGRADSCATNGTSVWAQGDKIPQCVKETVDQIIRKIDKKCS